VELAQIRTQLSTIAEERDIWERIASEADHAKAELALQLESLQASARAADRDEFASFVQAASAAASKVHLDEADTRELIDQQLRDAGWEADSTDLRYSKGARPQRNRNLAIAEWPSECGVSWISSMVVLPVGHGRAAAQRLQRSVSVNAWQLRR